MTLLYPLFSPGFYLICTHHFASHLWLFVHLCADPKGNRCYRHSHTSNRQRSGYSKYYFACIEVYRYEMPCNSRAMQTPAGQHDT